MERMKINLGIMTKDQLKKLIVELDKENKKLKEENNRLKNNAMEDMRVQTKLEEEIKNLKEKVETLELWLDNKEKVNKSLREELSKLKDIQSGKVVCLGGFGV